MNTVVTTPLLSIILGTHLLGALLVSLIRRPAWHQWARMVALATGLAAMAEGIWLWQHFDAAATAMQFVENHDWIAWLHARYIVGVDGISLALVVLTCFMTLIVTMSSWRLVKTQVCTYLALFLWLQATVVGVFVAMDAILFYVFWEAMLIPMYLCISIWGSHNRSYAADKFFIYTFLGSALMLVAILYLGFLAGTFYLPALMALPLPLLAQKFIFVAFLLAFAIKLPMWPVHTWLPDAHTEAPAAGSVILAALMLKVGGYGFLRLSLPIVPDACQYFAPMMIALSLIAIVAVGLVAMVQSDMKRLIAYSSVAHMGFVTLGLFVVFLGCAQGAAVLSLPLMGGMVQMITHGFGSGALFLAFGFLYERLHTRQISDLGGIATVAPKLAAFFMLFCLANVGLPGTSGFVGEFMVILGVAHLQVMLAALAALTLIVSAAYTLWMYRRVFYGTVVHGRIKGLADIDRSESLCLLLLAAGIIGLGLMPQPLLTTMQTSVNELLVQALTSKLPV